MAVKTRGPRLTAVGLRRGADVTLDAGLVRVRSAGEHYEASESVVLDLGTVGDTDEDAAAFVRRYGPLETSDSHHTSLVEVDERDDWTVEEAKRIRTFAGEARRAMWLYVLLTQSSVDTAARAIRDWHHDRPEEAQIWAEKALFARAPFGHGAWQGNAATRYGATWLSAKLAEWTRGVQHILEADPAGGRAMQGLVVATDLRQYVGLTLFYWVATGARVRICTGRECRTYLIQDDERRIWHSDTCRERHRNIAVKLGKTLNDLMDPRDVRRARAKRRARRA